VLEEDIPALPKSAKALIRKAIEERLTTDPIHYGKPLRYSYKGHRRLRVSDYRVIYRVDMEARAVFIVAIGHRKDIYDE
jgi:addiction module RelE/StbE family toxin